MSLFRKEVLAKQQKSRFGRVVVIAPIAFSVWTVGIALVSIVLVLFLCLGKYTRRQEVPGYLVPDKGIVNIYPKQSGTVVSQFVHQGDTVEENQPLYLISTIHYDLTDRSPIDQQIALLKKQIEVQKSRIIVLKENSARHKKLFQKKILSEEEFQKHNDVHSSATLSLHDLEGRLSALLKESSHAIRAPCKGRISTLTATIGGFVTEQTLLASMIPEGAVLEGVLFVPPHAIGYAKPGEKIMLKYQAYPHQQFGLHEAVIMQIDSSILTAQDLKLPFRLEGPFYRVTVALKEQSIVIYGKPTPLMPGMLFEATMLAERRSLWQWILGPIFGLKESTLLE